MVVVVVVMDGECVIVKMVELVVNNVAMGRGGEREREKERERKGERVRERVTCSYNSDFATRYY